MPGLAQPQQRSPEHEGSVGHGTPGSSGAMVFVLMLGCLYVLTSAGLISYNKYLINEKRFPYAVPLVLAHMSFSTIFAALLLLIKPSLFPALTDPAKKVLIDTDLIFKGAMPIAFFFTVQLVLSNTAYLHSSVAFLQMMKEANLVLVYLFSLVVALERFTWRNMKLLVCILIATTMTIHGELNFSFRGFAIQGTSQLFECIKLVLQAMLLTNAGRKLDALTYVLIVCPLCVIFLGAILFCLVFVWPNKHLAAPQWEDVKIWWPHLTANAFVAFCLNVVVALFVKYSSAVAFILAGIVKDCMIVCAGALVLREIISPLQTVGFGLQLFFITLWSMNKNFPEKFDDGWFSGFFSVLFGYGGSNSTTALVSGQKGQHSGGDQEYGATDDKTLRPNITQK